MAPRVAWWPHFAEVAFHNFDTDYHSAQLGGGGGDGHLHTAGAAVEDHRNYPKSEATNSFSEAKTLELELSFQPATILLNLTRQLQHNLLF